MNPVALKYEAALFPSVNLVPKDIQERRKMRAVRFAAGVAVLIAIGLVVIAFLGALGAKAAAQSGLNDASAQQDEALQKRDSKAPVYDSYVAREQEEYALAQVGYGEIDYSQFATSITNTATNDKSSFVELHMLPPSPTGLGANSTDPLFGTSVGSFTFVANSLDAAEARKLVARIDAVPGVASIHATAQKYTNDSNQIFWQIKGSGVITPVVLTMRIIPEDSVTGIDVLTMVDSQDTDTPGVAPTPAPSPAPSASSEG